MKKYPQWLKWASELQAVAQNGLTYCNNPYDLQRYTAMQALAAEIMSTHSQYDPEYIQNIFASETGYATPKFDVRGVIIQDDQILMVKESCDGLWTLPGGYADINQTPSQSVVREIFEESGYEAKALKLLAFYDMHKHDHPAQWPHIFKSFFLCEITGGEPHGSLETLDVKFFPEHDLPPLSLNRVTAAQIQRVFEHSRHPEWPTDFD